MKEARSAEIFVQICNHNYLLADAAHRLQELRPLLNDYRALVIDEAHKLPDAARQMRRFLPMSRHLLNRLRMGTSSFSPSVVSKTATRRMSRSGKTPRSSVGRFRGLICKLVAAHR